MSNTRYIEGGKFVYTNADPEFRTILQKSKPGSVIPFYSPSYKNKRCNPLGRAFHLNIGYGRGVIFTNLNKAREFWNRFTVYTLAEQASYLFPFDTYKVTQKVEGEFQELADIISLL